MATDTWVTIPTIATGDPVPDKWAKGVWDNTQSLANPTRVLQRGQTTAPGVYLATTSAVFVAVPYWTQDIYTSGRDFFVSANIWVFADAGDTVGAVDLQIDGVSVSGGTGIMSIFWQEQPNGYCLTWPFFDVVAGLHTVRLMIKRTAGVGNLKIGEFAGDQWLYITEF